MKIVCLGAGPAGLYFSILAKKANPSWEITVVERPFVQALQRFEAPSDAEGIDLHGTKSSDS